ncbi:MAG: ATP-binding protein [Synergistetes bacterium]|nr:ATP-binding protein [Synergistota bacterium]MCX8128161.1 ATP-binding protein [Synergistota bacterium]MDW8192537.1 ATP-binding protein [Synergistota bacterium]
MEELSLNILDIVENSVSAGASIIKILLEVSEKNDVLKIVIEDNGKGMEKDEAVKALDPFYTSKSGKRVGLGLPIFAQVAEGCGGSLTIDSEKGKGTKVTVQMKLNHIDRPPLGDLSSTILTIIAGHADIDFFIYVKTDYGEFKIDTREIKEVLGKEALFHPEVIRFVKEDIEREINAILKGGI